MRESAHTESWDEANRLLKRKQGEVVTGRFAGGGAERVKIEHLLNAVELDYQDNDRATLADVQMRNKLHLVPAFGHLRAADLTTSHVKRYIKARQAEGASNASVNRELSILKRAFRLAAAEDPPLVFRVPYIPKLLEENVREGFLDLACYENVRNELPEHLRALFVIGYHTGVRLGELRQIQWPQVDFEGRQIHISRKTTKNRDAHTLPIYGDMAAWLEKAKAERDTKFPECPWVFFGEAGEQIGTFYKAWSSACERAGVPGLLFHDLRRSAAMNMDRAGVPRAVIMQITGHKTESMFLRYRIVSSRDLTDATAKLETYLRQPAAKRRERTVIEMPTGKEPGKESLRRRGRKAAND